MTEPVFTVATVTYNSGKWISEAIISVLNSSFKNFELLISDDASTDDTWEKILKFTDPRIKIFRQQKNIGEYKNRNFLLSQANGKYFLFVDGDDLLYKHTLRNIQEYFEDFPSVISIWGIYTDSLSSVKFPKLLSSVKAMEWIYLKNNPIALVSFAETVFKTDALIKAGGFSEKFIAGDTYIKKKISLIGDILLIPVGLSYWRMSETQASSKLKKDLLGYKTNVWIDNEILADKDFKRLNIDHNLIQRNISVRNIKRLFSHTFFKGKFLKGIKLFNEMSFKFNDLKYLFFKVSQDKKVRS